MQRRNDHLLHRAADLLRREGIVPFCARAARRLRESVIETNAADWYCIDLSTVRAEPHCPPDVEIDFNATDEALTWLRAIRTEFNWVGNETELQVARTAGHVIGLGRVSGEKVGFIKVGVSSVYVTDYSRCVRVPAKSAFLYDEFVHPSCRGRNLATLMMAGALTYLSQMGFRFAWGYVPRWNLASRRVVAKCGFEQISFVRYVRIGAIRVFTRDPEKLMRRTMSERARVVL